MTDDELIRLAKQGDRHALHDLIGRYLTTVERFAYQIGVSANDVEDVTQEVFLRVYRFLHQYSGNTFTTWLYKVTLNTARDHFKKLKREENKLNKLFRQPADYKITIEPDVLKNEDDLMLHSLIQHLDEKYKVPLILFYFHEKKQEEIADILNIPLSTVKTRLSRAKTQLKRLLSQKGGEFVAK